MKCPYCGAEESKVIPAPPKTVSASAVAANA